MADIFPRKKEPVSEFEDMSREDFESRRDDRDLALMEEARARVDNMFELNKELIQPGRLKGSEYHQLLVRDLKISNLEPGDVETIRLWVSLIDHLLYIEIRDAAIIMHAELVAFLASKSSVDGFERKALITTVNRMFRDQGDSKSEGGRKLF